MKKNTILMILAIGMMSGGFYNDTFATNVTEQTANSQKRVLMREDAKKLIEEMKARGSTELVIPNGYTSVDDKTFARCDGLTSVTIPEGVQSIGDFAFCGCKELASVTIPEGVQSIGDCAFYGCEGLTSVTIPDNVQSIGDCAFLGCSGLTSITIPDGVQSISGCAFAGCEGLKSITIPDRVQSIGDSAFYRCIGLTSITIPDSVKSIGREAFLRCDNLKKIYVYSDRVKELVIQNKCSWSEDKYIDPSIVEVIAEQKNDKSYQQIIEQQERRIQALDAEIADLLANNPVTQERARVKKEADERYGLELDNDSAVFDDSEFYEKSRGAYEAYKQTKEIAEKELRLARIKETLAKK